MQTLSDQYRPLIYKQNIHIIYSLQTKLLKKIAECGTVQNKAFVNVVLSLNFKFLKLRSIFQTGLKLSLYTLVEIVTGIKNVTLTSGIKYI